MQTLWHDLRYALRSLAQRPGFSAVVVLTLALGIGANSAIFSVVDAILLTPLPYTDPERLVMVRESTQIGRRTPVSAAEYVHLRDAAQSLSELAAFDMVDFNLVDDTGAERVAGAMVSASFFPMLGVDPVAGRFFGADEAQPGKNRVVVISHGLWQRRFGGERDVVGRELRMSWNASFGPSRSLGETFTVIGVLPPGFLSPMGPRDLWLPLALTEEDLAGGNHYLFPFGRLAPGVTEEEALAELSSLLQVAAERDPGSHGGETGAYLVGLAERSVSRSRQGLLVLWAAVGGVLLIACVNVAHLVLARDASRERELALRTALGASRGRLMGQLLVESSVLAACGGVLGLAVGYGGVELLRVLEPGILPRVDEIGIDREALGFTLLVTAATAVVFGLLPAFGTAARTQLAETLRDGSGASPGVAGRRFRGALTVVEVALAVVLVAGAGLLFRSFLRIQEVDLGFRPENVLGFQVSLPPARYEDAEQRKAFYREAKERIAALPEVRSVGLVRTLPMSAFNTAIGFTIDGAGGELHSANMRTASAGYFETLGIPLLAGETLTEQHVEDRPQVVVVNRSLAGYWGDGADPLGQHITLRGSEDPLRVIGIVGDVHQAGPLREVRPTLYVPALGSPSMAFAVATRSDPDLVAERVRQEIAAIDPGQPIHAVASLEQMASQWVARPRFNTFLMALFAGLALVLAALGIYGVLAFSISRRTREMGIRMALGARRADVLRLVVGQGMRLVLLGLGLGVAAALALGRFLESLLFEIEARDPVSFLGTAAVLLAVALLATYVPARRATQVDPTTALRHD